MCIGVQAHRLLRSPASWPTALVMAVQAPCADVHAMVNLTERARGTVSPSQLTFTAANWALSQARGLPACHLCTSLPDAQGARKAT